MLLGTLVLDDRSGEVSRPGIQEDNVLINLYLVCSVYHLSVYLYG